MPSQSAQRIAPAGDQENYQKAKTDYEVGNLHPAPRAVVLARFSGVGRKIGLGQRHFLWSMKSRATNLGVLLLWLKSPAREAFVITIILETTTRNPQAAVRPMT